MFALQDTAKCNISQITAQKLSKTDVNHISARFYTMLGENYLGQCMFLLVFENLNNYLILFLFTIFCVLFFSDPKIDDFNFIYASWTPSSPERVAMHVLTPIGCISRNEFFFPSWQLARLGGG